jgi:hypothetical protein
MIRHITAFHVTKFDVKNSQIEKLSYFEPKDPTEPECNEYLSIGFKCDRHPLLYRRKMICRQIERIARTDHDSYLLTIHRDSIIDSIVTLDCTTVGEIKPNFSIAGIFNNIIEFKFEEYFTDEEHKTLCKLFESGEYDNLVGVPEF